MEDFRIIYPSSITKYKGTITKDVQKNGTVRFRGRINTKTPICFRATKSFKTLNEAEEFIKKTNIDEGLPIKNIIREHDFHMEFQANDGRWVKFDKENLSLVEERTYSIPKGRDYVTCHINGKTKYFHALVTGGTLGKEESIDHKNRDPLDNRRENLRVVSKRIQSINRSISRRNKSGVIGVCFDKRHNCWVSYGKKEDGTKVEERYFVSIFGEEQAKNLAIRFRKDFEKNTESYVAAFQK